MSRTSEPAFKSTVGFVFVLLTLVTFALRFWHLREAPFGLDSDQSQVLYVGHQAIEAGRFWVHANESTGFEALSTYLYATADSWWGSTRELTLFISFLDLLFLGLLLRRRKMEWPLIMAGVSLLASAPIAFYYSRVAGPCVGVSTILLGFFLIPGLWGRSCILGLGLFYYSIFKLLWIYEVIAALLQRGGRRFFAALAPLLVFILASRLFDEASPDSEVRGFYNFNLEPSELLRRGVEWGQLWFWSPGERFVKVDGGLIVDPVSRGLGWLLGSGPALGMGLSLLLLLAFFQGGHDFWTRARRQGFRNSLQDLPHEIQFFLCGALALVLSPTYSHAIFLVPLAVYFVMWGFQPVLEKSSAVRAAFFAAVLMANVTGGLQSAALVQRLRQPGGFDEVFADRVKELFQSRIRADSEGPVFYFTAQQYYVARNWARTIPQVQALPVFDVDFSMKLLKNQVPQGEKLIVYFDMQKFSAVGATVEVIRQQQQQLQDLESELKNQARSVQVEDIQIFDGPAARRYVIYF